MPSFPSPEPTVSCFYDLDFFKDFENEFPSVVNNDAPTSKSDLLTEPTLNPQHIDKFDLKDETSLSEYDEEEENVLYFNDLFPFNIIQPDDLKSKKDNDDNEVYIIQSSRGNEITQGSNMLFDTSHDKINKTYRTGSFVMNLKVNIVIWNYYVNGMLFYLILNLYVSFGIPFDPKRYYKDGVYTRMLQRTRGLPDLMAEGLSAMMLMEHRDAQGIGISSARDFLGTSPSYSSIRDLILRLCHRLIACSIVGRRQAPKKFIARLAEHFGLLMDDTWAWVALGPERQPDVAAGAPGVAQDAPVIDEGDQTIPAPVQAPPPPPAAARLCQRGWPD
ncbi:hypothetical protein Tco_0233029 [Tanacetum coccineum]